MDAITWLRTRKGTQSGDHVFAQAHDAIADRRDLQRFALQDQVSMHHEHLHQSMGVKSNRRGTVRKARGISGEWGQRSVGSIPWYVPEGAEWDLVEERSTRQFIFDGEQPWTSNDGYDLLDEYHARADALAAEELDDWDVAPLRRSHSLPVSEFDHPLLFRPRRKSFDGDEVSE